MAEERLQKVLARAGVASRRAAERMIREGRVAVNGTIVTEMGVKVDPERDTILVNGEPLKMPERPVYLLLNKPPGYLSVMDDPRGRPDLGDLVEAATTARLFPVGRLDMASEGLVLLTNDGELANRMMHPRYEHPKTYLVFVKGQPRSSDLWKLRRGVQLEDGRTAPARVDLVSGWPAELKDEWWRESMPKGDLGPTAWLRVTIREGRKRQVRRMMSAVGYPVVRLIRVGLGPLRLGHLAPGKVRPLRPAELRALRLAARVGGEQRQQRAPEAPKGRTSRVRRGGRRR